jgi:photosystem II stability/assembly factor-like uncharacterized protein
MNLVKVRCTKMKQLLFYVIVILFILLSYSLNTFGQGNWEQMLPPGPTSNQMVSLYFVDENTGWSVGEHGTILKTTNSGENWRIVEIPWLTYFLDVFFANEMIGYSVGQDGIILKTTDGGESWSCQQIRFTNNLHRVKFRDENMGWVIGEKGLILHTIDGGENWEQQINNNQEDLFGIDFISADSICVVGEQNTILISPDFGQNWHPISFTTSQGDFTNFEDVYFLDQHHGWIAGGYERGIIVYSSDGGLSWSELNVMENVLKNLGETRVSIGQGLPNIQQIYFSDLLHGLCLTIERRYNRGGGGYIYYTKDGGIKWEGRISGGKYENYDQPGRFYCLTESKLVNTGYQGEFRFSDDGGQSWYYKHNNRAVTNFIIGNNGIVATARYVLDEGTNLLERIWSRSEDYGKTWQDFKPLIIDSAGNSINIIRKDFISKLSRPGRYIDDHETLRMIYYQTSHPDGAMFESKDYGLTWHWIYGGVSKDLLLGETLFLTPDTLIQYQILVEEESPNLYKSVLEYKYSFDGGRSVTSNRFLNIWNDITPLRAFNNPPIAKDCCFLNNSLGFIVGTDGNIIKTEDTGLNWRSINSGVVETLWDIQFLNSSVGFIVGDFGRILRTEDGGETWRKLNSGTQENIFSIAFKSESEGWVGTESGLRYTIDGGESWHGVPMRYQQSLIRYVEFDKNGNGYAFTPQLKQKYLGPKFSLVDETGGVRPKGYNLLLSWRNENVSVEKAPRKEQTPITLRLNQNYPNPFNCSTTIHYQLSKSSTVKLKIFNLQGQLVRELVNESQKAGEHSVNWDGRSNSGKEVTSGVYIYSIESDKKMQTKKMLYLR